MDSNDSYLIVEVKDTGIGLNWKKKKNFFMNSSAKMNLQKILAGPDWDYQLLKELLIHTQGKLKLKVNLIREQN